jgi:peptidyl-prolyl cis-trans isomerase SurA
MKRVVGLALALAVWTLPVRADIIEQILVKVNGDIITKTDLEKRQIRALRERNLQANPADLQNDETLRKILLEVTPQILVSTIDEMLLVQRGRELGYRLSDEQFKQIIENIKKENKIETDAQFQIALDQEGLTMEDFRKQIERQLLVSRVQQNEVAPKLQINEEEAKRYYDAHPQEFATAPTITLREILVKVETPKPGTINVGADEDALEKVKQARARVLAGEDFGKLASEVSDSASKANGGLIGPINRSEVSTQLLQLLDSMAAGQVTDPIRTQQGYQILKLETATKGAVQPFEQVRDLIADKVYEQKSQVEFSKYLDRLRAQAIIEWKNADLKRLYDGRLAEMQKGAPAS